MKYLLIVLLLCASLSAQQKSGYAGYDPSRDAAKDVADAVAQAAATGRNVMVEVGGNWCTWCRYMDTFFEQNSDIREFRDSNYVLVKVNFSPENKNELFLSQFPKFQGFPHIIILDGHGKLLQSQETDVLESGRGYSRTAFEKFLKKFAPEKSTTATQS